MALLLPSNICLLENTVYDVIEGIFFTLNEIQAFVYIADLIVAAIFNATVSIMAVDAIERVFPIQRAILVM